jgi:hypothetical protein
MLATPWYQLNTQFLLPGLIVNAWLMYLFGTLLHKLWSHVIKH